MFGIFNNADFVGFWANKKEDKWAEITVQKLKLQDPRIFWYEKGGYTAPEFYRFDENYNLIIRTKNEAGEIVDTDQMYPAETYQIVT